MKNQQTTKCITCNGTGESIEYSSRFDEDMYVTCYDCNGTGKKIKPRWFNLCKMLCPECGCELAQSGEKNQDEMYICIGPNCKFMITHYKFNLITSQYDSKRNKVT